MDYSKNQGQNRRQASVLKKQTSDLSANSKAKKEKVVAKTTTKTLTFVDMSKLSYLSRSV